MDLSIYRVVAISKCCNLRANGQNDLIFDLNMHEAMGFCLVMQNKKVQKCTERWRCTYKKLYLPREKNITKHIVVLNLHHSDQWFLSYRHFMICNCNFNCNHLASNITHDLGEKTGLTGLFFISTCFFSKDALHIACVSSLTFMLSFHI